MIRDQEFHSGRQNGGTGQQSLVSRRQNIVFGVAWKFALIWVGSFAGMIASSEARCTRRVADPLVVARYAKCNSRKMISYLHNNIVTPYNFQCAKAIQETCVQEGCAKPKNDAEVARCQGRYVAILSSCQDEIDGAAKMAMCKDSGAWTVAAVGPGRKPMGVPATGTVVAAKASTPMTAGPAQKITGTANSMRATPPGAVTAQTSNSTPDSATASAPMTELDPPPPFSEVPYASAPVTLSGRATGAVTGSPGDVATGSTPEQTTGSTTVAATGSTPAADSRSTSVATTQPAAMAATVPAADPATISEKPIRTLVLRNGASRGIVLKDFIGPQPAPRPLQRVEKGPSQEEDMGLAYTLDPPPIPRATLRPMMKTTPTRETAGSEQRLRNESPKIPHEHAEPLLPLAPSITKSRESSHAPAPREYTVEMRTETYFDMETGDMYAIRKPIRRYKRGPKARSTRSRTSER